MSSTYKAHEQQGILLNANENPENLSSEILDEIAQALKQTAFNRYPEDGAFKLRQAYADWLGVNASQVLAGNGSDQMLQVAIQTFIQPGDILMTLDPDFGMYDFYCSQAKGIMEKFAVCKDGSFDLDAFIERAKEVQPSLVLFSNPNNPSGNLITKEQVRKLAQALPNTPVIMDEAYMEFAQDSALELIGQLDNLYLTRTLSKMFGLAAMRVGFLISTPENIAVLDGHRPVYNLSTPAQVIGTILLGHAKEYEAKRDAIVAERLRMEKELAALEGITLHPSAANFICLYPQDPADLAGALKEEGIQIRSYPNKDYVRITVGSREQNDQVLDVIRRMQKESL